MHFEYLTPTRVVFGSGAVGAVGKHVSAYGSTALVVCGRRAMRETGTLDRVVAGLADAGVRAVVYDQVSPDPKAAEVDAAVALARRDRCELIVGLGGGSAIDAAKAVGVSIEHESVAGLIGQTIKPGGGALPVIAIPTTAGSGAEVTRGSIITDTERNLKSGIRGDDVFPKVAIVDPDLTATMPRAVAIETGFDALTHALESYVARKASPLSETLSERAFVLLADGLQRLAVGEDSPDLRQRMCFAALLGGLNVATASTCLPHRLQQAMGAVPHISIPHARGLAAVYRAWLRHAEPHAPEKFARAAALLGGGTIDGVVGDLLVRLEMDAPLNGWGFAPADVDACMAGLTGNVENDPIDGLDSDLMRRIYQESLTVTVDERARNSQRLREPARDPTS